MAPVRRLFYKDRGSGIRTTARSAESTVRRKQLALAGATCMMDAGNKSGTPVMANQRGFTLMELLLAIAVLAIVTTAALPSFNQFILNNRLAAQGNELVTAFQMARSEALRRGVPVQVCSSADAQTCGGDWSNGWITVTDEPNPELLRVWGPPGPNFQITADATLFEFEPNGFSAVNGSQSVLLQLNGCSGENAREILLEPSGRVALRRVDCL